MLEEAMLHTQTAPDSEIPDLEQAARKVLDDHADPWLDTENEWLGGRKPRELIGTDREELVRDLLRAIESGSFS
jgi:uncharacterized protein (DUF2384 family)